MACVQKSVKPCVQDVHRIVSCCMQLPDELSRCHTGGTSSKDVALRLGTGLIAHCGQSGVQLSSANWHVSWVCDTWLQGTAVQVLLAGIHSILKLRGPGPCRCAAYCKHHEMHGAGPCRCLACRDGRLSPWECKGALKILAACQATTHVCQGQGASSLWTHPD